MSRTIRTVRFPDAEGMREQKRSETASRWRADRAERLRRAARDEKRIERADRHGTRGDDDLVWQVGSTVRAVA